MKEQDIDKIFRDGLQKREVPFNMQSWHKMEEMLPPVKSKKGGGILTWALAAAAGIALIGTIATVSLMENNDERASSPEITQSETLEKPPKSFEPSEKTGALSNETAETGQAAPSDSQTTSTQKDNTQKTGLPNKGLSIAPTATNISKSSSTPVHQIRPEKHQARFTGNTRDDFSDFTTGLKPIEHEELLSLEQEEQSENETIIVLSGSDKNKPKINRNSFGLIGGIGLANGIESSRSLSGNEFIGLTYNHYFKGGLMLQADLYYQSRRGVNVSYEFEKKEYDFGSRSEQTTIYTENLNYIELPVSVKYSFGRHFILAGVGAAYMFNCKNRVETVYVVNGISSTENETSWGYTEGLNKWDFSVLAGYEFMIIENLNLGLRINYGLNDITNGTYGSNGFDNNIFLRAYISYTPFNF